MIRSFNDKETEKIYHQNRSLKLPINIQKMALRRLTMLDEANNISDLRTPPSNHLEKLTGDRAGQYSIRINKQYRICFNVENEIFFTNVEIVDYH